MVITPVLVTKAALGAAFYYVGRVSYEPAEGMGHVLHTLFGWFWYALIAWIWML